MKSVDGPASVKFIEGEIYPTFNTDKMDFWPEDDDGAMILVHDILKLPSLQLKNPSVQVYWLPRLMQVYNGATSVYSDNDSHLTFLMANLAGTTLMTTHLTFMEEKAESALKKSFSVADFGRYSELRAFFIEQL